MGCVCVYMWKMELCSNGEDGTKKPGKIVD